MSAYRITPLPHKSAIAMLATGGKVGFSGVHGTVIEASGIKKALHEARKQYPAMQAPYSLSRDEAEAIAGEEVLIITKI